MRITIINPEMLAQTLESAAYKYEGIARSFQNDSTLLTAENREWVVHKLNGQVAEAREWADAFRGMSRISFDGDDIQVVHR